MLPSLIITFRETLEAALIIGIVLSYLKRTQQSKYNSSVYFGLAAGIGASILGAVLFNMFAGGFSGRAEEIFEGVMMFVGAMLLTTMVLWMIKQKNRVGNVSQKIDSQPNESKRFGIFSLVFVAVLREGIETVVYLNAAAFITSNNTVMFGGVAGIFLAILLGYGLFKGAMKVNIKRFFHVTSVLLILFAAGLIAHGTHELQEANIIPTFIEHVWDTNAIVNEAGHIGSLLKGLFGYNGNPSLIEVLGYMAYISLSFMVWKKFGKSKNLGSKQIL